MAVGPSLGFCGRMCIFRGMAESPRGRYLKALSLQAGLLVVTVMVAVALAGCPLPFDYNGRGAGSSHTVDPSSPNITAPVAVSYSEQGGTSGTVANGTSVVLGNTTTVTLSTATNNAIIYYTDDGTALTSLSSAKKINGSSGQFTVTRSTSIQSLDIHAVAVGPDMLPSQSVQATVEVSPYPILTVTRDKASVSENNGTATFTITSSIAPASSITVTLKTGGTYVAGDLTGLPAVNTTFTATLTQPATTITLPITAQPDADGINDTVTLTIQPDPNPTPAYTVGATASASVMILADPLLTLTADRAFMVDGQTATFTVTASFTSTTSMLVNLSSSGYTAGEVTVPTSVTIPAGATSATFPVSAPSQTNYPWQSPVVSLASGSGYKIGSPGAQGLLITDITQAFTGLWNFASGSVSSSVAGASPWTLSGSVSIVGGSLSFSGNYMVDSAQNNITSVINQSQFTLGVSFRLADLSVIHPIVVGGASYRWLILQSDTSGNLSLVLNNHAITIPLGYVITAGSDHTLLVSIDTSTLAVVARLDGVQFTGTLPGGFAWNNPAGTDLVLLSDDLSSAKAFAGLWHWIYVASGVL